MEFRRVLFRAFAFSLNTVAAKLGQYVGYGRVADMARRFGITTPVNTHPSMVLGTSDVRLIDMTRAFASVANGGGAAVPYGIRSEEQTSELQSLMRISYAVFCLKKKK